MNRRLVSEGLDRLGITAEGTRLEQLERYLNEIELWNPRYGLVHASGDELVVKHLLDSLAALPVIEELLGRPLPAGGTRPAAADEPFPAREAPAGGLQSVPIGGDSSVTAGGAGTVQSCGTGLCDVGSGAGFPGIPLAMFLPHVPVTLIESSGRRVSFLKNAGALLGLTNLTVRESRVEDAVRTGTRPEKTPADPAGAGFAVVTFRAFKPLDAGLLATLGRLTAPGGWVAAYKGRRERLQAELDSLDGLVAELRIVPIAVPFLDEERHLVLLRPKPDLLR